jgi:hypothetical protein
VVHGNRLKTDSPVISRSALFAQCRHALHEQLKFFAIDSLDTIYSAILANRLALRHSKSAKQIAMATTVSIKSHTVTGGGACGKFRSDPWNAWRAA